MPERRTLVIALILTISGVVLRFYYYFFLGQYALKLLIAISIVILVTFVVLSLIERRSQTYKDLLTFAVVVAILCGLTRESAASNKLKNQKYLRRLSSIVNRYIEQNHTTPDSFAEAHAVSGEKLPNRGDADGNPYTYIRLSDRIYLLRSYGSNEKNDRGAGDDVVLNYLDGNYVSSKELSTWIPLNGTEEEKYMLEVYRAILDDIHLETSMAFSLNK